MPCDFTTPKGRKITSSDEKIQRGEQEEEDTCKRVEEQKAGILFNFYIVYFGYCGKKKKIDIYIYIDFFNTVFVNPDLLIHCIF